MLKHRNLRSRSPKRHHKHRRGKDSSTSSSSSSNRNSANTVKLLERLNKERERVLEERQKAKELMKATETPQEKRLRRLKKRDAKERARKERMGWDSEYLHYTNEDNPFGDANLLGAFVWQKKLLKDGLQNATSAELEARNRAKQAENRNELEKVKRRRQERELERQQRDDDLNSMQRNREAAQFDEWARQEDHFHLKQARLRSQIRIQDGRAKAIDLLAKYISAEDEVDTVEMHEPYTYLHGLQIKDLEDLIEDIKVYEELERGKNVEYWSDITVIVQDELQKLHKKQIATEATVMMGPGSRRDGINEAVSGDINTFLKGKTASELANLQGQIEAKIHGHRDGIDVGYWESLLSHLKAHMARARLRDCHQQNLKKKLLVLRAEQAVESKQPEYSQAAGPSNAALEQQPMENTDKEDIYQIVDEEERYQAGGYSPKLLSADDLELGTILVSEEDDEKRLEFARIQLVNGATTKGHATCASTYTKIAVGAAINEDLLLLREARKGMDDDEAQFSVEAKLENAVYLWSDKYRPRKPRYFNRVHTGFEWNKYNQTHYDMDNPPPKIVQGYKFNIFYPDLIDKQNTPQYFLIPCADNRDFAILKFHAGPPYEDIAFKIVNREWEYSYKRGFRCQFHNNIFQLWFHFKRYRYRR